MTARALLAAALLSLASAASAVPIDAAGDAFSVAFDGSVAGTPAPGLTASATFLVTEFDAAAGRVVLQITLSNTTDPSLFHGSRVGALGFDIDATLTSASASGLFSRTTQGGSLLPPAAPVDVCASGNAGSCTSGLGTGANLGQSGVLLLTLNFAAGTTSLDLTNFGVRYQTVDPVGCFVDDAGIGHGTVPEPRALALLGVAGLALLGRRRR